ncbi:hypothetical protein Q4E93_31955 [Flavitalea sp. BT771]|uniref:hypothetical protein n=1 Tax=Flavitalea sp. BT771 TaxID=3063329 RepID=UPI0026E2F197|nr:hypothetical protein [Flavitalea sp. BT771]MDO6435275.1 hypothetical protein [Flavitalea sp. BT771]MDV6224020.1 hypothetical protein [Flavitalea sp. BT771]
MFRLPIIRRLSAGALLALFTLSIMPRILVHSLVAKHKDVHLSVLSMGNDGPDQVNKASFHCNVESLVVELPCLWHPFSIQLTVPRQFQEYQVAADHQFHSFCHFIFGLRGPPAAV